MKPKIRIVLEDCIETGIRLGYSRAFKHLAEDQLPDTDHLHDCISNAIWLEIDEKFEFDEVKEEV